MRNQPGHPYPRKESNTEGANDKNRINGLIVICSTKNQDFVKPVHQPIDKIPHRSGQGVSNSRPRRWQRRALPTELRPQVGAFMPPAPILTRPGEPGHTFASGTLKPELPPSVLGGDHQLGWLRQYAAIPQQAALLA